MLFQINTRNKWKLIFSKLRLQRVLGPVVGQGTYSKSFLPIVKFYLLQGLTFVKQKLYDKAYYGSEPFG